MDDQAIPDQLAANISSSNADTESALAMPTIGTALIASR